MAEEFEEARWRWTWANQELRELHSKMEQRKNDFPLLALDLALLEKASSGGMAAALALVVQVTSLPQRGALGMTYSARGEKSKRGSGGFSPLAAGLIRD